MNQGARLGPLRKAREAASAWRPRFTGGDARFDAIAAVSALFAEYTDWPDVTALDRALGERAGVRFVAAQRRPRRQRGPVALGDLYDAHIARGEVPTRARNWHDFLNALVWATFPRAKRALHARQHTALQAWARTSATPLSDDAGVDADRVTRLPNARTRELDALALIDEGGVLITGDARVIFGHALYEGFVLAVPSMIARGVILDAPTDDALAARLTLPLTPETLPRVPLQKFPS